MSELVHNSYWVKKAANRDYGDWMEIVEDVADEYGVADPLLFSGALKEWWEGSAIDVVMRANLIMEEEAFYVVAARCKKSIEEADQ